MTSTHQSAHLKSGSESAQLNFEASWKQIVHAEINAVINGMRKNGRWLATHTLKLGGLGDSMGLRTGKASLKDANSKEKDPLWEGFTRLKQHLDDLNDVKEVDALELVLPFLQVICFGNTTGPVAAIALGSIEKFLNFGILNSSSPNISQAMNTLTSAACGCKFVSSDSVSDELVLLRMLQVLEKALVSDCGQVLSDEAVCEIMESGLSMCCQKKLSEMLRKSAEHSMINMIVAIFERLKNLEDEWSFIETPLNSVAQPPEQIRMCTPKATPSLDLETADPDLKATEIYRISSEDSKDFLNLNIADNDSEIATSLMTNRKHIVTKPYGIPTIRELLRVLISLLNPYELKHTDSIRIMALGLLNVAFEVGGISIGRFEVLRSLITDDFCKYAFQLAKTNSTPLLSLILRVIVTVFDTLAVHLKLQQELFLSFLIQKLSSAQGFGSNNMQVDITREGVVTFLSKNDISSSNNNEHRSSSPNILIGKAEGFKSKQIPADLMPLTSEAKGLLLECLLQFARQEYFMVDLWYNYDCSLTSGDLFEELVQFLCKSCFPDPQSYSISNYHLLCLDALTVFVTQMAERAVDNDLNENYKIHESENLDSLIEKKRRKGLVLEGGRKFNESPKKSVQFLIDKGVVVKDENGNTDVSLARFLRTTQQLDKKTLGEYLGKEENFQLLKVYMRQFDFKNVRMDEALRMVLETFRLPGESQQILRITDTFAETFFESGSPEIDNVGAAEVLAYSIVMLNTDQHNPQVRSQSRMSVDQYIRNLSGVNNKGDFPRTYLTAIYKAIQQDEILMPEEHEGLLGFNYAWKQLQHRSQQCNLFERCSTSSYDSLIFALVWKPLLAGIFYAFNTAQDDNTLETAIKAFHHYAALAAQFDLTEALDSVVTNLATATGLLHNDTTSVPDPIVDVAGQKFVVSRFAVRFGRDYKGQLAAVVLFSVVARYGNGVHKSWIKILGVVKNLFLNSLLPNSMLRVEDFLSRTRDIPLKPKQVKPSKQAARRDGSILSTLSSYLLSPYSSDEIYSRDPTEEEVEMTMCAVDCVSACRMEDLFANVNSFSLITQKHLLDAVRSIGYDLEEMKKFTVTIPYDPVAALFLELMVTITIRNSDRVENLWSFASEYILGLLSFSEKQSVLIVERTVVGLIRLCICAATRNVLLDQILQCLSTLRDFPPSVTQTVAEQIMAGATSLSSVQSEFRK
ncbi:hypothetical protein BY458DRAFT_557888 [Sporodiniella umbellata]|nr:hypothetical protein BY458DRAFT_557888 [Sporodiniella umbellata]